MISLKLGQLPAIERLSIAIFSFVFIIAGLGHLIGPDLAIPYMPEWMPWKWHLVFWTGFTEIAGGIGLLLPKFRKMSAWFLLMHLVAFLSLHGWHVWVGGNIGEGVAPIPVWLAWMRLAFQFVLIWLMWKIAKRNYITANG
jgi:uncharacterized membrane protein